MEGGASCFAVLLPLQSLLRHERTDVHRAWPHDAGALGSIAHPPRDLGQSEVLVVERLDDAEEPFGVPGRDPNHPFSIAARS